MEPVVIIGAGPGGLTAAYQILEYDEGRPVLVLESSDTVGGISQTAERDGWRFDLGGHRFFTKVGAVEALWHTFLPDEDFLLRPRMSRILYNGVLFDYPLQPLKALRGLGIVESFRCLVSFVLVRLRPPKDQTHFEGWVAARFGWRLYRIFFKTYTEKVWGVPATAIQADWAAQRIKDLDLMTAVLHAFGLGRGKQVTTLIDRFQYPKLGPGMMWQRVRELVEQKGGRVALRSAVVRLNRENGQVISVDVRDAEGRENRHAASEVVSTMPLPDLVRCMRPAPPARVITAANGLRHRDFMTIALVVPEADGFPDNWIYIHTPGVRVGRVQNFGSWSPYLVKDGRTCLGLEYFVNEGDDLWSAPDAELSVLAEKEITALGLVPPGAVEAAFVVRVPKAYPVYDNGYSERVEVLREWLAENTQNVHPVGRNGMHRYNNQDHSMLTAMLVAENITRGTRHDPWTVNVEEEYHEQGSATPASGRDAPVLDRSP
jgi:protoporphyrinogen oxidase